MSCRERTLFVAFGVLDFRHLNSDSPYRSREALAEKYGLNSIPYYFCELKFTKKKRFLANTLSQITHAARKSFLRIPLLRNLSDEESP